MEKRVSIFGSYKAGKEDKEYKCAYEAAYKLGKIGYTIVNGGGGGIMEASTLGAADAGGRSIGVVLDGLYTNRDKYLNKEVIVCRSLYERLKELIDKSSAYIIFSGGTGTFAELALVWELTNKRFLKQNPIICYGDYWKPVIDTINNKYLNKDARSLVKFAYSVGDILSIIKKLKDY